MDKLHLKKILFLGLYFSVLAVVFWFFKIGYFIWPVLILSAIGWLVYEYPKKKNILKQAVLLGIFLMVFDFIVENAGGILGFWSVGVSLLYLGYVPVEVMVLILVGGTAWAMAQPEKIYAVNVAADVLLFTVFGALGEFVLIHEGMMEYSNGWNSIYALAGYFATWVMLHCIWHKFLKKRNRFLNV